MRRPLTSAFRDRVYPWAELLEGYNALASSSRWKGKAMLTTTWAVTLRYYDKDQHFPDGPSTWLFGE